uniref:Odorant receptor n=1 Tax=Drosophila mojavensis TaxID=7230 RepID=A0A386IR00_DROMO|nr:odorant receptor 83c2 [Drosophila mojavensis]
MSTRASDNFNEIMRFVRFITSCVGFDVYDPNFHFSAVTITVVALISMYFIFTILTIAKEFHGNWMFMIQASAMSGSVVQACAKIYMGVSSVETVSKLYVQLNQNYTHFEKEEDARYSMALLRSCHKLRRFLVLVGISYMVGALGMIIVAVLASILTGKLYLIMHFHLPGIDVNTEWGAWATQALHCVCIILGGLGLYTGDMIIIVYLMQSFVYADILQLKVDHLNALSENQDSTEKQFEASAQLINIAKWHQTYTRFIDQCNDMFSVLVSVQVTTSAVCIVITIFSLLTSDWIGGYCYFCVLVPNMYLYCILGTILENCSEKFMYELYNISFYNLNPSQQRFVLFMLAKSQQPGAILLLGVMPLSVSSALQVTKSIYSITMMMARFLQK